MKKPVSMIAAVAENLAIGKDNDLLWHLRDDLKRFKKLTSGHKVVMGSRTYFSMKIRPLPDRENIILTSKPSDMFPGCVVVRTIEEALGIFDDDRENFILGGGKVYARFMPHADKMYITLVHAAFDADTFFPRIDRRQWKLAEQEEHKADENNEYDTTFLIYVRKKSKGSTR